MNETHGVLMTLGCRQQLNFCFDFYHPTLTLGPTMALVNQPLSEKLKAARESRGLSLADVAHKTRIPIPRLVQLEEGNYAAFGSMAYARSFIRTYSKYLEVDAEEVIQGLPTPVLGGPDDYRHLTESYGPWVTKRGPQQTANAPTARVGSPAFTALVLTVCVFVGLAVFAFKYVIPGLAHKASPEASVQSVGTLPAATKPMAPAVQVPSGVEVKPAVIVNASPPMVQSRRATLAEEPGTQAPVPQ